MVSKAAIADGSRRIILLNADIRGSCQAWTERPLVTGYVELGLRLK